MSSEASRRELDRSKGSLPEEGPVTAAEWFELRKDNIGTHYPGCWMIHPDCAYWQGRADAEDAGGVAGGPRLCIKCLLPSAAVVCGTCEEQR